MHTVVYPLLPPSKLSSTGKSRRFLSKHIKSCVFVTILIKSQLWVMLKQIQGNICMSIKQWTKKSEQRLNKIEFLGEQEEKTKIWSTDLIFGLSSSYTVEFVHDTCCEKHNPILIVCSWTELFFRTHAVQITNHAFMPIERSYNNWDLAILVCNFK